jgi:tRNA (uracil-5-)-methyltransferase TRM9
MREETKKELLSIVKLNYSEAAEEFSVTRKKYLWPELLRLTEGVKDGDSILDVGCGNGRLTLAFKDRKVDYTGIDASSKLIEIADREHGSDMSHFFIGDILSLGDISVLNNKTFDYVFSVAVLHHIPSMELRIGALKQLKEKLKENGTLIITVWNLWVQDRYASLIIKFGTQRLIGKNDFDFGDIIIPGFGTNKDSKRYYHAFIKKELQNIAEEAEMKIIELYKDERNYYMVLKK